MSRRILAALLALGALFACTAATSPKVVSPDAPPRQAQQQQTVTLASPMLPLNVGQLEHSAFPGLVRIPSTGELQLVWRQGSDHYLSRDGDLMRAVSRDDGASYGELTTLRTGADFRDPNISQVGGALHMTMFTGTSSAPAQGAWAVREWGLYRRIDGLPYAAISAPIVQLPNGQLGAAFYGRLAGESIDTAWMGWSSDSGQTWTTNRIMNSGVSHAEPWLVVDGGLVHMLARFGSDKIAMRTSTNSGQAGSWGPTRVIIDGCTGRPTTLRTQAGTLIVVCRGPLSQGPHAKVLYSLDHGATWIVGPTALTAPAGSPHGMTYAAMAETSPGVVHLVVGMEQADGSSRLYGGWLSE